MANSNQFGLTNNGFAIKTFTDILDDLNAETQNRFPGADVSAPSVLGTINSIYGLEMARLHQVIQSIATSFDPTQAEGPALDTIGFYRGITRNIEETDSDFRIRILNTSLVQGQNTSQQDRICTFLRDIPFVEDALVIVNEGMETNAAGIPPRSYVPVIYVEPDAGNSIAVLSETQIEIIAETLLGIHPVGVNMYAPVSDVGYHRFLFNTGCGPCRNINFILASKVRASIDIDYRTVPSCNGCGINSPISFNNIVADYFNSAENCQNISPTLFGATLSQAISSAGTIEILNYTFRLHEITDDNCDFFYEQSPNTPIDVGAALLSLSLSDSNPIDTNYAYVEFDADCFASRIT